MNTNQRRPLPNRHDGLFLTDAGLETELVFHDGMDLPSFAAFPLVDDDAGRQRLVEYYEQFMATAAALGAGFVLESPTWRANPDWGPALGYDADALAEVNRRSIALLEGLRAGWAGPGPVVISGNIGPRSDGYSPTLIMNAEQAAAYHSFQVDVFAETSADVVTAVTLTYVDEAIGIATAAARAEMPVVLSFTVETDGHLISGPSIAEAIAEVDDATGSYPTYFMVNCAHPTHFRSELAADSGRLDRIGGVRANASALSHSELDESEVLDDGNPEELAQQYVELRDLLPGLAVVGGCCGTDHRHVEAIGRALRAPATA